MDLVHDYVLTFEESIESALKLLQQGCFRFNIYCQIISQNTLVSDRQIFLFSFERTQAIGNDWKALVRAFVSGFLESETAC